MRDPYIQHEVEIVERIQESPEIVTVMLRFTDPKMQKEYTFIPGQFNMVYLYGIGEVAISIVSDPVCDAKGCSYAHTFAVVGHATAGLANLKEGDRLGIRGPFGRGWPVDESKGKNVIFMTGGLGCAPSVAAINYILARRKEYGELKILQGVRCVDAFIYDERYENWGKEENTEVILSSDQPADDWEYNVGSVVTCVDQIDLDLDNTVAMLCGPEGMMKAAAEALLKKGMNGDNIYVSLERNMKCGLGHCGHCQCGPKFVCKDGPVFPYSEVRELLKRQGV